LYVVIVPFVMFLGWNAKPKARSIAAIGLACLGAYLLSTSGRMAMQSGDLLELGGALLWALHVVLLGKFASRYEAISFSAGQLLVCGILSGAASIVSEPPTLPLPLGLVFAIVYTAIVSLVLGYTLQIWGQRHTPPTDAAIILGLEAVFAALAGALVLGERMTLMQVLGCATIVLAVFLSQLRAWSRIDEAGDSRAASASSDQNGWI
jgi:drug/metabolite transporter (DMT)-like permease